MPTAEKTKLSQEKAGEWYDKNVKTYRDYAQRVHSLLESLLEGEDFSCQSISFRIKERNSFLKKCRDKEYTSTEQVMDMAGHRIIAYTVGDVEKICALIEQEFSIDEKNSVNKAAQLKSDQIGYLSVHYIVTLPDDRVKLKEYRAYKGLKCEIQVRTLLQHTWAEFEHDRGYKFVGKLPQKIERRLYLLAGMLEMADLEFQDLSNEIEAYGQQVAKDTKQGKLDIPIDSISLLEYMREKVSWPDCERNWDDCSSEIVAELHDMGIDTLAKLEEITSSEFLTKEYEEYKYASNYIGFLRYAMILHDVETYFSKAWNGHWQMTDSSLVPFIESCGINIRDYLENYGIEIEEEE